MRCVTPMFRRYELGNYKNGKVVPRNEVIEELCFKPNYIRECLEKVNAKSPRYKYEQIPCGHCYACSLNYSAEWATRIMLEAEKYECNFWITLTYNDDNLPIAEKMEYNGKTFDNVGDLFWNTGTLYPEHMNKFIKDLRNHLQNHKNFKGVKYYYCGEYGEKGHRPHYHIILLNCPLDITKFYDTFIDENYKAHWKSYELEKFWDKGLIDICELEWSDAAYTARYTAKKIFKTITDEQYAMNGKVPEYVRMSKGIGMTYFIENYDKLCKQDGLIAKTVKGNVSKVKLPRRYMKEIEKINPELARNIKNSRLKAAERNRKMEQYLTDLTDREKLIQDAEKIKTKASMLPRNGEF